MGRNERVGESLKTLAVLFRFLWWLLSFKGGSLAGQGERVDEARCDFRYVVERSFAAARREFWTILAPVCSVNAREERDKKYTARGKMVYNRNGLSICRRQSLWIKGQNGPNCLTGLLHDLRFFCFLCSLKNSSGLDYKHRSTASSVSRCIAWSFLEERSSEGELPKCRPKPVRSVEAGVSFAACKVCAAGAKLWR